MEMKPTEFIFGKLVKYKPAVRGNFVDEDEKRLIEKEFSRGVIAYSEFYLHVSSNIIAYHPIVSRLSSRQFRTIFSFLFQEVNDDFFVSTELRPITEEMEILEAFKNLTTIKRITVNCHPTNPSNRDVFKPLDEKLKKLNAENFKQELIGGNGGLKINELEKDDIYPAIVMATDGYGKGIIEGEKDGRKITISTDESPVKKEVVVSDDPATTLDSLINIFKQIWQRTSR